MAGYLTTHVLDTGRGCPAAGLRVELYALDGSGRRSLADVATNTDGRTDTPILAESDFLPGTYELVFHAGAYLAAQGKDDGAPRFLDLIPIRFGLSEPVHYHVPLLLSAFGYSTYRGS